MTIFELELMEAYSKRQAEFEQVILQLAENFVDIPLANLHSAIEKAMQLVTEFCKADRAVLYRYDRSGDTATHLYEWDITPEYYTGDVCKTAHLSDFETPYANDSLFYYPMTINGDMIGLLALSTVGRRREWAENEKSAIKILSKILQNILTRKEQEMAYREVNRNNQIILDSINEGVGMYDRSGYALQINRHLSKRFGIAKEADMPADPTGLSLPRDRCKDWFEKRKEKFEEVFRTGRCVIFEDAGDGRWYSNRLYPVVKDGGVAAVTLCSTDITEKKSAEAEAQRVEILEKKMDILQKKEAEYLEIFDGSTIATWIKDLVNGTCQYSTQWSKRLGGGKIPNGKMNAFLLRLTHPDDRARLLEEEHYINENKPTKFETQYRLKTTDGSYIWVLDKGKITYDAHGNPIKIYGTTMDITAQKKSEAIILRQNKVLKTINMIYEKAISCESVHALGAVCLDIIESITSSKFSFIGEVGKDGFLHAIAIREPEWDFSESELAGLKGLLSDFTFNSLFKDIITNGKSLLINDPAMLPDSSDNQDGYPEITSFLGVPFFRDNAVAGLLAAANRTGGFGEDEKEMLEAVAPTVFEVLLRKFTEETVKENEFLMRTIMDSSSDFLYIKDKDSRIVMVNQAYESVFGVNTNDIIGKNDYDLYPDPEMAKTFIENDLQVMETGKTLVYEESAVTADGLRTYLMSKEPWHDSNGGILGILGIAHDITELKKAEAALQEMVASLKHSKAYINILYETTGKVLSSLTPREEITELCTKVMNFLDCHVFFNYLVVDDQPLLRLNACGGVSEEQKLALDHLPLGSAVCGCAIRDGCRIITENIQTTQDPRTEFLKEIGIRAYACHPLMADGKAIGGLAFGTKSKDQFSEEALMLMKTVAESVAVAIRRKQNEETLLKQADALLIADHNKNEFLSTLSHELRNPMATITAALSLLDISGDKAQQEKAKQIMQRQMEYLCRLVDDLLDITRITHNKIVLKQERFELNSTAISILIDMKALFDEKGVRLASNIRPGSIYIYADPVRVKQAIGNLLHNALKFSNSGNDVTLSVVMDGNCVLIGVKDNGIGIEPAFMDNVFEPFTQEDKSIDRRNGGLGLGLSIVKGIAELHGGSVYAHSNGPGKGSAFTLCLPVMS